MKHDNKTDDLTAQDQAQFEREHARNYVDEGITDLKPLPPSDLPKADPTPDYVPDNPDLKPTDSVDPELLIEALLRHQLKP